jgi:UDP-N-acetylglucosamine:LPS N-acetylglucosamine transferase
VGAKLPIARDPAGVLILSAGIGEGHDLPARWLAAGLAEEAPGVPVKVEDGLKAMGRLPEQIIMSGSSFDSRIGNLLFDIEHWLMTRVPPLRSFVGWASVALGARGLLRLIERENPAVVVSTYPGVSETLGRLRLSGRLHVPAVSAITDLASLRFWAHPGVDLHLITHPESAEEVREVAGSDTDVVPVRGLHDSAFVDPPDRDEARRVLGLPPNGPVIVVSGGGWGVGDMVGAVDAALAQPGATVVVMCGRNEELRRRIDAAYGFEPRVRPLGFTDQVPELFSAADALVHSTAGLTVLEAYLCGCATISYGWGRGHIRANNRAFLRFGLADVAATRAELGPAIGRALARPRSAGHGLDALPTAAGVVCERFGIGRAGAGARAGDAA